MRKRPSKLSLCGDETLHFFGDVFAPAPFRCLEQLPAHWVCNLEAPVTNVETGTRGKINLKTGSHFATSFPRLPSAVSLATNHAFDYGDAGFEDTRKLLERLNIKYFGVSGQSIGSTSIIELAGLRVALLGYVCPSTHPSMGSDYGPSLLDLDKIAADIREARVQGSERVVVYLHWGDEEIPLPSPENRERAREILDSGADIIIGNHAHCIQGWEVIGGKPIFYGLGNLVTPDLHAPSEFDTLGRATKWYIKRQFAWNQKSMSIGWDPRNGKWAARFWRFRRGILSPVKGHVEAGMVAEPNDASYANRYRRVCKARCLKRAFLDNLNSLTLINLRKIRTAGGMTKDLIYSAFRHAKKPDLSDK